MKTNGSINELNKLSIDELETELNEMDKDSLVRLCMKAIWAASMLDEHIAEMS